MPSYIKPEKLKRTQALQKIPDDIDAKACIQIATHLIDAELYYQDLDLALHYYTHAKSLDGSISDERLDDLRKHMPHIHRLRQTIQAYFNADFQNSAFLEDTLSHEGRNFMAGHLSYSECLIVSAIDNQLNIKQPILSKLQLQEAVSKGNLDALCLLAHLKPSTQEGRQQALEIYQELVGFDHDYARALLSCIQIMNEGGFTDENSQELQTAAGNNNPLARCYLAGFLEIEYRKALQKSQASPKTSKLRAKIEKHYRLADEQNCLSATHSWALFLRDSHPKKTFELLKKAHKQKYDNASYDLALYYEVSLKEKREPKKAAEIYENLGSRGHQEASARLGKLYLNGDGVKKDIPKAIKLFRESGKYGLPHLAFCVATRQFALCEHGVEKDALKAALELYRDANEAGNGEARMQIALCHAFGLGVNYNTEKAYTIIQETQDKEARPFLGLCYELGIGIHYDLKKAYEIYQESYQTLHHFAGVRLGLMYLHGRYTNKAPKRDTKKAFEIFERLEKLGSPDGRALLGMCYLQGIYKHDPEKGLALLHQAEDASMYAYYPLATHYLRTAKRTEDYKRIYAWLERGHNVGCGECTYQIGLLYLHGSTPFGIVRNHGIAYNFFLQAARMGSHEAMVKIGILLQRGVSKSVPANHSRALQWFQKAFLYGNSSHASELLAIAYEEGVEVSKNGKEAFFLYIACYESTQKPEALLSAARLVYKGHSNLTQDLNKAFELYSVAYDQLKSPVAMYYLAKLYRKGQGASQNFPKAQRLYESAIQKDYIPAMLNYGIWLTQGKGISQDLPKALHLFKEAAKQGSKSAKVNLARLYSQKNHQYHDMKQGLVYYTDLLSSGYVSVAEEIKQTAKQYLKIKDFRTARLYFETLLKGPTELHPSAKNSLGTILLDPKNPEKNPKLGIQMIQDAAKAGHSTAKTNLDTLIKQGKVRADL